MDQQEQAEARREWLQEPEADKLRAEWVEELRLARAREHQVARAGTIEEVRAAAERVTIIERFVVSLTVEGDDE